jgi:fructose-bisphosphate aldolase class II
MPVVPTGDLVAEARAGGTAVLALNAITLEHGEAIVRAAERTGRASIVQVSQNAVRYHGSPGPFTAALVSLVAESDARIALHLDHVEDVALLRTAPDAGFSSVMFDASALPYRENVDATRAAAEWAHANGLWVEAELGYVGGKPDAPVSAHAEGARTDPDEAAEFVAATGVDALAVAVGSTHAMTTRSASLDHDLIAQLRDALPVPLVLHGSSGVPDDVLMAAIAAGMTKINIGTVLNVAFTGAVRDHLASDESVDPRRYLAAARDAATDEVARLLTALTVRPG